MKCVPLLLCLMLAALAAGAAQDSVHTVIVPVVGTAFGPGVIWKTSVEIINDTGSDAVVTLELSAIPDSQFVLFRLAPGEVAQYPDILPAFGVDLALSPLRVDSFGSRAPTVRATVYALRGTEVSQPQPIAVYQGQSWFPLRALDGLSFSDEYRTNIGLVNFGDEEAEFVLVLQRLRGRNLAVTHTRVAPHSLTHASIQSLFPLIGRGDAFTVLVETGSTETYAYGSVIDRDNNGRFVAPRVGTR
ncbi:MAG TPA: hypothetical protein VNA69_15745 [Thermoanaerobaculia bacterium]|nr:hypothetical protein [Thermoanaerobaculia bacterium]